MLINLPRSPAASSAVALGIHNLSSPSLLFCLSLLAVTFMLPSVAQFTHISGECLFLAWYVHEQTSSGTRLSYQAHEVGASRQHFHTPRVRISTQVESPNVELDKLFICKVATISRVNGAWEIDNRYRSISNGARKKKENDRENKRLEEDTFLGALFFGCQDP